MLTQLKRRATEYCGRQIDEVGLRLEDERGAALIITLVMLVMLSIMGLAGLSTSSTELFLSANYRRSKEAFLAADGAMEYAVRNNNYFVPPATGAGTQVTPLAGNVLTQGGVTATIDPVIYLGPGMLPAGSGMGENTVQANYFMLRSTGTGTLGSSSQLELVMAKIVPG